MKKPLKIIVILLCVASNLYSQQVVKMDNRKAIEKEDPYNFYDVENISQTDILKAIELLGMRIYKFDVPGNTESHNITILAREFKNGHEVNTDTIANFSNDYHYWVTGIPDPYIDYINGITIFTDTHENQSELQLDLTSFTTKHEIALDKTSEDQFFLWRKYTKSHTQTNKEIPLMIFASSWMFPGENFHRFCGVAELTEGDPMTKELLEYSKHYIQITVKVE